MRLKTLQTGYNSIPLTVLKPKSLKYRANCKKLEQLRCRLYESLSSEQINEIDNYITLLDQQSLAEQQQSFCVGVAIGAGLEREVKELLERGAE